MKLHHMNNLYTETRGLVKAQGAESLRLGYYLMLQWWLRFLSVDIKKEVLWNHTHHATCSSSPGQPQLSLMTRQATPTDHTHNTPPTTRLETWRVRKVAATIHTNLRCFIGEALHNYNIMLCMPATMYTYVLYGCCNNIVWPRGTPHFGTLSQQ